MFPSDTKRDSQVGAYWGGTLIELGTYLLDSQVGAYWGETLIELGTYLLDPLARLFKMFPKHRIKNISQKETFAFPTKQKKGTK